MKWNELQVEINCTGSDRSIVNWPIIVFPVDADVWRVSPTPWSRTFKRLQRLSPSKVSQSFSVKFVRNISCPKILKHISTVILVSYSCANYCTEHSHDCRDLEYWESVNGDLQKLSVPQHIVKHQNLLLWEFDCTQLTKRWRCLTLQEAGQLGYHNRGSGYGGWMGGGPSAAYSNSDA